MKCDFSPSLKRLSRQDKTWIKYIILKIKIQPPDLHENLYPYRGTREGGWGGGGLLQSLPWIFAVLQYLANILLSLDSLSCALEVGRVVKCDAIKHFAAFGCLTRWLRFTPKKGEKYASHIKMAWSHATTCYRLSPNVNKMCLKGKRWLAHMLSLGSAKRKRARARLVSLAGNRDKCSHFKFFNVQSAIEGSGMSALPTTIQ